MHSFIDVIHVNFYKYPNIWGIAGFRLCRNVPTCLKMLRYVLLLEQTDTCIFDVICYDLLLITECIQLMTTDQSSNGLQDRAVFV